MTMRMRRLLMLPLLFAVTTGSMFRASAENQSVGATEQIRIKECWFTGQTNNNIMFRCVLTNTTEHPVEVALYGSRYKLILSTPAGEWLAYLISQQGNFCYARSKRPSLIIPAYESRVHEKALGAFGFDRPHQGDVRVEVVISPCPYFSPTNSLPGVMLFNEDLKFDEIMEARQTGNFLFIMTKLPSRVMNWRR